MPGFSERIGEWTTTQLTKFVQTLIRDDEFISAVVKTFDEVTINRILNVIDEIKFSQTQNTVGSAGSASALPATPSGYIKILDPLGQTKVIPYYNAS